jgi:hypothetical protein
MPIDGPVKRRPPSSTTDADRLACSAFPHLELVSCVSSSGGGTAGSQGGAWSEPVLAKQLLPLQKPVA